MTILTERERVATEILLDKGYSFIDVADKLLESRNRVMRNDMAAEVAATMGRTIYPLAEMKQDTDEQVDETLKPDGIALEERIADLTATGKRMNVEIGRLKEEVITISDEKETLLSRNKAHESVIKIAHEDIAKYMAQECNSVETIARLEREVALEKARGG